MKTLISITQLKQKGGDFERKTIKKSLLFDSFLVRIGTNVPHFWGAFLFEVTNSSLAKTLENDLRLGWRMKLLSPNLPNSAISRSRSLIHRLKEARRVSEGNLLIDPSLRCG